jgi:hypothetical protein
MMVGATPEVERSAMLSEDDVKRRVSHVRTKKRVADHGEVLTGQREVNAMLDLVKQETERIDSRFLEPACGDGNFLIAILEVRGLRPDRQPSGRPHQSSRAGVAPAKVQRL